MSKLFISHKINCKFIKIYNNNYYITIFFSIRKYKQKKLKQL